MVIYHDKKHSNLCILTYNYENKVDYYLTQQRDYEEIDRLIEQHPQQIISTAQVVKAMILNGLGFVSAPL